MRNSPVPSNAATNPQVPSQSDQALHLIQPVADIIACFPATRYYGSKRKLLRWIYENLSTIHFDTVLDAFGGTGSVSLLFKVMHKHLTYHDGFRFNEDVARAVLADQPALARAEVETLLSMVKPRTGTISNQFSGIFFKDDENAWLDGFMTLVGDELRDVEASALLRYLVYQACLKKRPFNLFHRSNLKLRTAHNIKRSFGNGVTWERSFKHHAMQAYDELLGPREVRGGSVTILPSGNAADLQAGYDLIYIDPPYIRREDRYNRDDYWRRYHFLEGLARYDEWGELIDPLCDIRLFSAPPWFIEWGRARSFPNLLFDLIDVHRHSVVILSYVTDAVPSESEIKAHFEARFSHVSIHSAAHSHALSKTRKRELLFIGYPR